MLLPYDKGAYRSVNSGIVTVVYVHSVLQAPFLVTLVFWLESKLLMGKSPV